MKKLLKLNYRHYICILITFVSLLFAFFYFTNSYLRIYETLIDVFNSLKFYIKEIFEVNLNVNITINNFTSLPFKMPWNLPNSWEEFKILCNSYFSLLFTKTNFILYLKYLIILLNNLLKILIIILPFVLFYIIFKSQKKIINNNYNLDSKLLIKFKKLEDKVLIPIKLWFLNFYIFLKKNNYYLKIWIFIWAYNFNFIAIFFEFIGYYLYFVCSFDFASIYIQILKLFMDLSIILDFLPLFVWFIIYYVIFDIFRKKIAYNLLNHYENKNKGFINSRSLIVMLNGTMGSKKTTCITDFALSTEVMFRDKAFEMILENDLKFPNFPFINLEINLKKLIKLHKIYNLATIKKYIEHLRFLFEYSLNDDSQYRYFKRHLKKHFNYEFNNFIFDYDYIKYGLHYNNGLYMEYLWDVLYDYARLYFVYVIESSLLVSNYSIRSDNIIQDLNNFPMWNNDFFKRDSRLLSAFSRHAHILDFDMLRLGKTIIQDNKKANAFDFGIINISEIGKERLNGLELQTIKKNVDETNQKNDLFNSFLKLIRHVSTIGNYPFVRFFTDDQRPDSLNADMRELCDLIYSDKCSEFKLTLPFFEFEDLIINFLLDKFKEKYLDHRFYRGDNTLAIYLLHNIISKINNYKVKIYNTFGYYNLDLAVQKGTRDEEIKKHNYYILVKKIYAKRFSTDCFNDYFMLKKLKSKIGINDLDSFKSEKATLEELLQENSYFFNELMKLKEDKK